MVNPVLEDQARRLAHIVERSSRLYELYKKILKAKAGSPEDDKEVRQIWIQLTQGYQPLMREVGVVVDKDDTLQELLGQIRDADQILALSEMDRRRLEEAWRQSELRFHTLAGELDARRRALAAVSPVEYYLRSAWSISAVRWAVGIAAVLVVLWITGLLDAGKQALRQLGKEPASPASNLVPAPGRRAA